MKQSEAAPPVQNDSESCAILDGHPETCGFYDELNSTLQTGKVKICNGTSCFLCGAPQETINLCRAGHECEKVYCLGHCDRSPVTLDDGILQYADCPTSIRSDAPESIVTHHLKQGEAAELEDAVSGGVYSGLSQALSYTPEHLISLIEQSQLRGRDRNRRLIGTEWRAASDQSPDIEYIVANGDESDPGSFIDRVLLEGDPHTIIEGMILSGYAVGATQGIIYIRAKYPRSARVMNNAIDEARKAGILGNDICGSEFNFTIRVYLDSSDHLFDRESDLIESIDIPDLDAAKTFVTSIETFTNLPHIVKHGPLEFLKLGAHSVRGTKAVCLNSGFSNPGVVEVEWGITLREIIEDLGGGSSDGAPLAAVLIGGPMGSIVQPKDWDLPLCYNVLNLHGIDIGHGGFVAIPKSTNFSALLEHFISFATDQSPHRCEVCQKEFPRLLDALKSQSSRDELMSIAQNIAIESNCSFGKYITRPIISILRDFL